MQSKISCSRLEVYGVWFLQHKQRGWGGCPCGTQTCHFQPGIYCCKKRYSISPLIHTIWGGSRSLNKFSSSAESEMYREQYGEYAYQRVKANFRSKCYFCVFRYCLFLIRYCIKCHFVFLYNGQQTFIFWRLLSHFGRQKTKCSVYWIQIRNLYWSRMLVFNLRSHWLFEVTSPLIGRCYYLVLVLRHSIERCVKEILVSESLWKWNDCLGLSY